MHIISENIIMQKLKTNFKIKKTLNARGENPMERNVFFPKLIFILVNRRHVKLVGLGISGVFKRSFRFIN